MFKYLKVAVTALSLTACVLLIALWVRSYYRLDRVAINYYGKFFDTQSMCGDQHFAVNMDWVAKPYWHFNSHPLRSGSRHRGFRWASYDAVFEITIPHWFLALTAGTLVAVPWVSWSRHFSLRTLLIATTLIAVVLGIVVVVR